MIPSSAYLHGKLMPSGPPKNRPWLAVGCTTLGDTIMAMSIPKLLCLAAGLYLVLVAPGASAQSANVDCESAQNTARPVELSYHSANGTKVTLQSYRQPSNDYIIWMRQEAENATFVTKLNYVGGILTESQQTTTLTGKRKAAALKFKVEGYPKNFDRRSDIRYKMTSPVSYADGTSDDSSVINSYKFKSEDKITIGACVLKVVYGETESMDPKTGKTGGRLFQLYFPELKLTAGDSKEPVVIDDLKTSFAPIAPLP